MQTKCFIASLSIFCFHVSLDAASVTYQDDKLNNGIVSVAFEKQGTLTITDAQTGEILLGDARFALP